MTDAPQKALPGRLPPLPNDLLVEVAKAIYGEDFAPPLARALNVSPRTVLRWRAGDARVTPFIARDLDQLLANHAASLAALRQQLAPHVAAVVEAEQG
jgi:hypothetical protein